MPKRRLILLLLSVNMLFSPVKLGAAFSSGYYPADSTVQTLILKRNGEIKKSISIGQQVSIKPTNALKISGRLNEINSEFLVVGQTKIPLSIIDWIKVRKRKRDPAHSFLKGIGIIIGIALLGYLAFLTGFALAYSGDGGSVFIGILIVGGLVFLFATILSAKRYRLRKYDLELR